MYQKIIDSAEGRAAILDDCITMTRLSAWIYDDRKNGWPADLPDIDAEVMGFSYLGRAEISTQGAAIVTRDRLYLVFRGSQSITSRDGLKDWLKNINFLLRSEFYGIKAHRGFVKAAMPVLKQIREILEIYQDIKHIEIGGHSLGGAIAVAVAVAVEHELRLARDPRQVKLITAGQPRISRKRQLKLALKFIPYFRIQNGSDIVPRKPVLGYSHAGLLIYTSNRGQLLFDPGRFTAFCDRLFTFRQRLSDHSAIDYLRQLLKHSKKQTESES